MLNQDIIAASDRIKDHVRRTTFEWSSMISQLTGADVWLKMENQQHTGSFKFRGAINKMLTLSQSERDSGIYGASTGNHGAAVAYACTELNLPCIIYVPEKSSDAKLVNMKSYGAEIKVFGKDCMDGELKAREVAETSGGIYLSPYNDPEVVNGQGTIAREIETQSDGLDAVIVSIGGGGLISGAINVFKQLSSKTKIIGIQTMGAPAMKKSIKQNKLVTLNEIDNFVDGAAVRKVGNLTFDYCKKYLDDIVIIDENEICKTVLDLEKNHNIIAEPAGAMSITALRQVKEEIIGKNVVCIICGGNNDKSRMPDIISRSNDWINKVN